MSPQVFETFSRIASESFRAAAPSAALEIGAGNWTLLSAPAFASTRRVALNLRFDNPSAQLQDCEMILGNGNALPFEDGSFDCVLSSSALEHDKYFWRTIAEVRRVLRKGGVFVAGVPIYKTLPTDKEYTTLTYARHGLAYNADFYRFSEQAVREVFFEGYEKVTHEVVVRDYPNPYLISAGRK